MDGYGDSAHLDIVHNLGCARGNSLRHDHHGLQRRALEDLFAAPHAKNRLYEGELKHTDLQRPMIQNGECVDTAVHAANLHMHI